MYVFGVYVFGVYVFGVVCVCVCTCASISVSGHFVLEDTEGGREEGIDPAGTASVSVMTQNWSAE